jgi:hypothetical protein
MHAPSPDTIDRIAAQTADDVRRLAGMWAALGAAALDQAVRDDPDMNFAVLDARNGGGAGAVKLITLRRTDGVVLLTFAQAADGARHVLAQGLGEFQGVVLVADPSLADVTVSAGSSAWSPQQMPPERLADMLAAHLDTGVTATAPLPDDALVLPSEFAPMVRDGSFAPALLAILDATAAAVGGHMSFTDALRTIVWRQRGCDLQERDSDLAGIYAVDSQRDDLDHSFDFKRRKNPDWTWEQELASYEAFAREHGEKYCRSLLARFRGDAFAKT